MKQTLLFLLSSLALVLASCSDDIESVAYRQELGMFTYHGIGAAPTFVTDSGEEFRVTTNAAYNLKPDTAYRTLMAFTVRESDPTACSLESLSLVPLLSDSTANTAKSDTIYNVNAFWAAGGFINLTVTFLHDNLHNPVLQTFGYRVQRTDTDTDGHTHKTITLFFRNNDDDHLNRQVYQLPATFSLRPQDLGLAPGDHCTLKALWKKGAESAQVDELTVGI